MYLEPLCLTLLVLLIQAIAYRILPVLRNNYEQQLRRRGHGNRLPGLILMLLFIPVLAWIPLRTDHSILRGSLSFTLMWIWPSKFLSIAWDTPIDSLLRGFFYFAIASIIPVRIKGCGQSKPKLSSSQLDEPTKSFDQQPSVSNSDKSSVSFEHGRAKSKREHSRSSNECSTVDSESSRSHSECSTVDSESSRNSKLRFRLLQIAIFIATTNIALFLRGKISIWFVYGIYCVHLYVLFDLLCSSLAKIVELISGLESYPIFNDPFLAYSISEYWERWNLPVVAMLRATVYDPVLDALTINHRNPKSKKQWRASERSRDPKSEELVFARAVATMARFLVCGFFHEVIFCYTNKSAQVTWEATVFFILHGFASASTDYLKEKKIGADWKPPRVVCRVLTLSFVYVTEAWLFLRPLTRTGVDLSSLQEFHSLQSSAIAVVSRSKDVLSKVLTN